MSAPGRTGRGSYARQGFFPVDREPHGEFERAPSSRPTPLVPLPVMRAVAAREQADAVARDAYRDGVPVAPDIARRTRRGIGVPIALPSNAAAESNWASPVDPYSLTEPVPLPPAAPYAQTEPAEAFALQPLPQPVVSPPSPQPEPEFWDRRPSLRPSSLSSLRTSQLPLPPPSFLRRFLTKLVFFTILSAVLLLLATEISIRFHLPWLDPRPALLRLGAAATRLLHRVH
jgi:hypothetical protein